MRHDQRDVLRWSCLTPRAPGRCSTQAPDVAAAPEAGSLGGEKQPLIRELTDAEVRELIARYGRAAGIVKRAGFTGVQIHGAHGYLVSQFLSPHHNQRSDEWGGSAEKRRRFVLAVLAAMRAEVGADFPIGIKLNSADFQRGLAAPSSLRGA